MGRKKGDGGAPRAKGPGGFERYFGDLFGDRWPTLKEALISESNYATLDAGLRKAYYLDRASLLPPRALQVEGASHVVDLCAAPGGKSLLLALRMDGQATLTANDRSRARLQRLKRVLQEHLPPEQWNRVKTTGYDAALWGVKRPESADAVLCDVPCSSERHVLSSPDRLAEWSESRISRLSKQAVGILASGFDALRPGGSLVYSTCALSPEENDAVVSRLLERRGEICLQDPLSAAELTEICREAVPPTALEETQFGYHILPDKSDGSGPIYFSRLRKADQL